VPELGSVVGLTGGDYRFLCSYLSLAYLGGGRFCVYRPVKVLGSSLNFNSFLVLEPRRRLPDGEELEIAKRGVPSYHGIWPDQGRYKDIYFIQKIDSLLHTLRWVSLLENRPQGNPKR